MVWMFPPDSPLHKMLFLSMFSAETQSTPNPRSFLPSNEKYIEGLENIWMKVSRGGLFSRGVLLLTTHRIIFIQYPSRSSEGLETLNLLPQGANSFVMTIPLCNICSVSLRRRWKDKFHTLGLLCKNQIGYLFVSSRDEDEFIPLRAFRRMKSEICARVESDLFATGVETDPFTIEAYPLPDLLVISDLAKLILKPFNLGDEYTR